MDMVIGGTNSINLPASSRWPQTTADTSAETFGLSAASQGTATSTASAGIASSLSSRFPGLLMALQQSFTDNGSANDDTSDSSKQSHARQSAASVATQAYSWEKVVGQSGGESIYALDTSAFKTIDLGEVQGQVLTINV